MRKGRMRRAEAQLQNMAGTDVQQETGCTFEWDENSKLYYHASTGFYHDPQAGWYYSSVDGLYYKFENGNYVLLESSQAGDQPEMLNTHCEGEISESTTAGGEASNEPSQDSWACNNIEQSEYPPPPSEWLEDTLIDMYLSGYSNRTTSTAASDMPAEADEMEKLDASAHGDDDIQELEEGEWIPDDPHFWSNLSKNCLDEGVSQEEENWRAQYGQVSQLDEQWMSDVHAVDLWDWALVREMKKNGKMEVARLVGRLMKPSSNLHPSVPSGGHRLKTAPVCEVHLDMVRVASGRIYRLKIPSLQCLASLSTYDASNPTKDWGFPQLSINSHVKKVIKHDQPSESQSLEALGVENLRSFSSSKLCSSKKDLTYRDRAAERRALHGGFGVGPGQKNSSTHSDSVPSSPTSLHPEEAAAKSLRISFGEGSYGRKILENMGWKEGESLGCSMRGLTEPLQAIGNKGNAGLGWENGRRT